MNEPNVKRSLCTIHQSNRNIVNILVYRSDSQRKHLQLQNRLELMCTVCFVVNQTMMTAKREKTTTSTNSFRICTCRIMCWKCFVSCSSMWCWNKAKKKSCIYLILYTARSSFWWYDKILDVVTWLHNRIQHAQSNENRKNPPKLLHRPDARDGVYFFTYLFNTFSRLCGYVQMYVSRESGLTTKNVWVKWCCTTEYIISASCFRCFTTTNTMKISRLKQYYLQIYHIQTMRVCFRFPFFRFAVFVHVVYVCVYINAEALV